MYILANTCIWIYKTYLHAYICIVPGMYLKSAATLATAYLAFDDFINGTTYYVAAICVVGCVVLIIDIYLTSHCLSQAEMIVTYMLVINFLFLTAGYLLMIGALVLFVATQKQVAAGADEGFRDFYIVALAVGICLVVVSFFGIYSTKHKSKCKLGIYGAILIFILCACATVAATVNGTVLDTYKDKYCARILSGLHEIHWSEQLQCNKYVTTPVPRSVSCDDKSYIAEVWELNYEKPKAQQVLIAGCLNADCCDVAVAYMESFYASGLFFLLFVILNVLCVAALAVWDWYILHSHDRSLKNGTMSKDQHHQAYGRNELRHVVCGCHRMVFRVFVIMLIVSLGMLAFLAIMVIAAERPSPSIPVPPKDNSALAMLNVSKIGGCINVPIAVEYNTRCSGDCRVDTLVTVPSGGLQVLRY